jgi:hypothetical protein
MKVEILVFSFENENREKDLGFGKNLKKRKNFSICFSHFSLIIIKIIYKII